MNYRIGEIASMLGISLSTLRFFENTGLICPSRNKKNDYRMYEPIDLNRLLRIKTYTECGFSLQETAKLLQTESIEEISSLYVEKAAMLEKEIERKLKIHRYICDMGEELRYASSLKGWVFRTCPGMYCFPFRTQDQIAIGRETQQRIREWTTFKPFSQSLVAIPPRKLVGGAEKSVYGMLIEEAYADGLPVREDELVHYRPKNERCVFSVYTGNTRDTDAERSWISGIRESLECEGFAFADWAIGRVMHTGSGPNSALFYATEYWFPVKPLKTA